MSVVHIHGDEILGRKAKNEPCIECLEELLEKAKNGEIVGIAVAMAYSDGATSSRSAGFMQRAPIVGSLMNLIVNGSLD